MCLEKDLHDWLVGGIELSYVKVEIALQSVLREGGPRQASCFQKKQ